MTFRATCPLGVLGSSASTALTVRIVSETGWNSVIVVQLVGTLGGLWFMIDFGGLFKFLRQLTIYWQNGNRQKDRSCLFENCQVLSTLVHQGGDFGKKDNDEDGQMI